MRERESKRERARGREKEGESEFVNESRQCYKNGRTIKKNKEKENRKLQLQRTGTLIGGEIESWKVLRGCQRITDSRF